MRELIGSEKLVVNAAVGIGGDCGFKQRDRGFRLAGLQQALAERRARWH